MCKPISTFYWRYSRIMSQIWHILQSPLLNPSSRHYNLESRLCLSSWPAYSLFPTHCPKNIPPHLKPPSAFPLRLNKSRTPTLASTDFSSPSLDSLPLILYFSDFSACSGFFPCLKHPVPISGAFELALSLPETIFPHLHMASFSSLLIFQCSFPEKPIPTFPKKAFPSPLLSHYSSLFS